jgi:hypothetical protein
LRVKAENRLFVVTGLRFARLLFQGVTVDRRMSWLTKSPLSPLGGEIVIYLGLVLS